MKKELDEKLVADFPELYRDRHASVEATPMGFGFSCGDGWEPIIRTLSEQLTFLAKAEEFPVVATQVKEKFGTLRFYVDSATEIMYACILAAEKRSEHTCEMCGEYGTLCSRGGWVKTVCKTHRGDKFEPVKEYD